MSACACSDGLKLQNSLTVRDTDREAAIVEEQRFPEFCRNICRNICFPLYGQQPEEPGLACWPAVMAVALQWF